MYTRTSPRVSLTLAAVLAVTASASAECPKIDFEDQAVGAVITDDYAGVTFSAQPQSCGGAPPVNVVIVDPPGTTSSGTKAITLTTGCPDFSPDYLRIVFDVPQSEVTFTLGASPGTYIIRGYDEDGVAFGVPDVTLPAGTTGVHYLVRITRALGDIKRIEIEDSISDFEYIDDLSFDVDTTPPIASIDSPAFEACGCGVVSVVGEACDPDGDYDNDKLEYMSVAGGAWTLVGSFTTPLCGGGVLYLWDTTPAEIVHGFYFLRLTVENACGLINTAMTVVYVDKQFESLDVRSPAEGGIVGGTVCFDGTVWDHCFDEYTVGYGPAGGPYDPVDPLIPAYNSTVVNDPFASWNTRAGLAAVADGDYQVEIAAADDCDNAATVLRNVAVDNTPPTALISDPLPCTTLGEGLVDIIGTVDDAHLDHWWLDYSGGDASGWVPIADGNAAIVAGVLGTWDTTGLARCAYTLRLRARDQAVLDCGPFRNETEYLISVNAGGCPIDLDGDGDEDLADFAIFQDCFGE